MSAQFLQFLFSGITVGATYALAALGFTLIYNASTVINFAQGEFIMLGGMLTVVFANSGMPLPAAILLAIVVPSLVGMLLEKLAIEPAGGAEVVGLIVITIGAIRRAGGTDKMKVRDALETTSGYIGTGGKVTMSASDHMGLDLTAFRMLEVRNGDWVLLN